MRITARLLRVLRLIESCAILSLLFNKERDTMKTREMLAACCCITLALLATQGRATDSKSIALVDAGYSGSCDTERIRAQVERYLNVPVTLRTVKAPASDQSIKQWYDTIQKTRGSNEVFAIGLIASTNLTVQQSFAPKVGLGIVNVPALRTNDTVVMERRILRLVMRDIAFLAGLPPSQDPFCVTRPYKDLADLDKMGLNYFPPYQMTFAEHAAVLGLKPVRDIKAELLKRHAVQPPAPPAAPGK